MAALERWDRFSLVLVAGMAVLSPAWISYASDPDDAPGWLLLGHLAAAPLAEGVVGVWRSGNARRHSQLGAVAGGVLVYCLGWGAALIQPVWVLAVVAAPLLAGAAVGQAVAGRLLGVWVYLRARRWGRRGEADAAIEVGMSGSIRIALSVAAAIAGAVWAASLFVWLFAWGAEGGWTDAIYIVPFAVSVLALAACSGFVVWVLEHATS